MYVESWYDNGVRIDMPAAEVSTPVAAADAQVSEKEKYEASIAAMKARLDAFPTKSGTMYSLLQDKIKFEETMLAGLIAAEPRGGDTREAYFCTDKGCWVAEQYFCDDTGCWLVGDLPDDLPVPVNKVYDPYAPPPRSSTATAEKVVVQQGIFAPVVKLTAQAMGRKELNAFRASVIAKHTKVISAFVDTSESKFGQIALRTLFEAAYVHMGPPITRAPPLARPRALVALCTQLTRGRPFESP